MDTFEANVARGHAEDAREYDAAVAILKQLGVESVGLLTNNPDKVKALEIAGLEVDRIPVSVGAHQDNAAYLQGQGRHHRPLALMRWQLNSKAHERGGRSACGPRR